MTRLEQFTFVSGKYQFAEQSWFYIHNLNPYKRQFFDAIGLKSIQKLSKDIDIGFDLAYASMNQVNFKLLSKSMGTLSYRFDFQKSLMYGIIFGYQSPGKRLGLLYRHYYSESKR